MDTMCPACSGVAVASPTCACGEKMEDSGPVTDYFGPYSPYFNLNFESGICVHLFSCPHCGHDARIPIKLQYV